VLAGAAVCGCATVRHEAFAPPPCPCNQGFVVVADGAGGWENTSASLGEAVAAEGLPLRVETLNWSHGCGRFLADQMDFDHARAEGNRLAGWIQTRRQACPSGRLYLVAHSAGSAVVLAAAECLPPDSVDRMVLLAPSVSANYDLRPALRCCRHGIEVFYSGRDVGYLGAGVALVGTADREWSAAAGRVGFRPVGTAPEDTALYVAKLRQHAWNSTVSWTGNWGGHHGCTRLCFLRAYVLPLIAEDR
jgi:pimeloyl-ACP methyl ester carboxylesterase